MIDLLVAIKAIATRLDLQRLSGIRRVMGIDLSESHARVVELERRGNPFDRFRAKFRPVSSFSCDLGSLSRPEERGLVLKEQLGARGVSCRLAVVGIHGRGVRTTIATVPPGTGDIHEWIREHEEKLLKLPVHTGEVSFRFTPLESSTQSPTVEITFVRRNELEAAALTVKSAGLELLSVEPGIDDLLLAAMLSGGPDDQHEGTILYSDGASSWVLNFKEGRKVLSGHAPTNVSPPGEIPTLVAGLADQTPGGRQPLSVLGLTCEYALACGLAICGLVRVPLDSSPLLPDVRKRNEERVYRSLWKRTVLALGSGILFMLAFLGAASWFLQSKLELIDDEIETAGPDYNELRALESSVAALQSRLRGGGATMRRTNSAKTLHESARAVPEGLWFTNVEISAKGPGEAELEIHGFARSHQEVSLFLRSLERSPLTRRVRLVRSGTPEADGASPATNSRRRSVAFHIAITTSS